MATFWLATFKLGPVAEPQAGAPPMMAGARPLAVPGAHAFAIEVIEEGDECAVLFSIVDNPAAPEELVCQIGFANGAKSCAVWADRGFPLSDAVITKERLDKVSVQTPCFLEPPKGNPAIDYETELISITNSPPAGRAKTSTSLERTAYRQKLRAPDAVFPATQIQEKDFTWTPARKNVRSLGVKQSEFKMAPARFPTLAPFAEGKHEPIGFWSGDVNLPLPRKPKPIEKLRAASRVDAYGVAAFRFEGVEMLGFRMDLGRLGSDFDKGLAELIKPLNFHLKPLEGISTETRSALSDFRYRPASRTVMVELLRYGKMKLLTTSPPLEADDFQSQHELVARILVGRVDDDTAEATDPATFVPSVFVDNPWSKGLGRHAQGFDKRMADFCVSDGNRLVRLRPDGRASKGEREPRPLGSIRQIRLSARSGDPTGGAKLLEIDCPYETIDDWNAFLNIPIQLILGSVSIAPLGWGQMDLLDPEFRRSFARKMVRNAFRSFNSIQPSPIGGAAVTEDLQRAWTWITSEITFDEMVRVARPNGTIGLRFHSHADAPPRWKALCKLLEIQEGGDRRISMPVGSWYRMRCSWNLKVNNGF